MPLKIFEFAKDLIIPISALYSYILGWVWTGLVSRGREGRGAVSPWPLPLALSSAGGQKCPPGQTGSRNPFRQEWGWDQKRKVYKDTG